MGCQKLIYKPELSIYYSKKQSGKNGMYIYKYRYAFNGKETDNENGSQDYGFRIYNSSICKFLSVDPLTKKYPELTPFQFASNTPIQAIDMDGLEAALIIGGGDVFDKGEVSETVQGIANDVKSQTKEAGIDTKVKTINVTKEDATTASPTKEKSSYKAALNWVRENYVEGQPFVIYGYSFGGAIATQLVAQLNQEGIHVDLLVLVDANVGRGVEYKPAILPNVSTCFNYFQSVSNILGSRGYEAEKVFKSKTTPNIVNKDLTKDVPNQPGHIGTSLPSSWQDTNKHSNIDEYTAATVASLMALTIALLYKF